MTSEIEALQAMGVTKRELPERYVRPLAAEVSGVPPSQLMALIVQALKLQQHQVPEEYNCSKGA
ncbi:hypothetical protein Pint_07492 [Pistacia integerrima]|uniref:Uncharacterized protein n=1 Tax=Pistacia integerrima TaxID=434235 RepID=A0ACC0XVI5_9ROSI|nr:hypothetical protein Pint_07492 [Pistacia integerrima]